MKTFEEIFKHFVSSGVWWELLNKKDNRYGEENVAQHIRLALQFYDRNISQNRNPTQQLFTKCLILLHEVENYKISYNSQIFENIFEKNVFELQKFIISCYTDYECCKNACSTDLSLAQAYLDFLYSNIQGHISDDKMNRIQELKKHC